MQHPRRTRDIIRKYECQAVLQCHDAAPALSAPGAETDDTEEAEEAEEVEEEDDEEEEDEEYEEDEEEEDDDDDDAEEEKEPTPKRRAVDVTKQDKKEQNNVNIEQNDVKVEHTTEAMDGARTEIQRFAKKAALRAR